MSGGTWRTRRKMPQSVYQWRERVWAARSISHGCRLMLVLLAEHMKADRIVSVPRERLAGELGVHVSRISEWVDSAIDAGYLVRVSPGSPGRTAVYQGTRPDRDGTAPTGTDSAPVKGAGNLTR